MAELRKKVLPDSSTERRLVLQRVMRQDGTAQLCEAILLRIPPKAIAEGVSWAR